jgi:hypothetical protein
MAHLSGFQAVNDANNGHTPFGHRYRLMATREAGYRK